MTATVTEHILAEHRGVVRKRRRIILALSVGAFIAFVISAMVGPVILSPGEVLRGLIAPNNLDDTARTVLWRLRLPMSVMAVLVGMSLAAAGAQMQTILNNPLAEPFTLGISAAAAFGGASAIVMGWAATGNAQTNLAAMAWLSAMLATGVILVAAVVRGASAETMILLGIGMVFLFQALLALMQYRATTESLQQIVFWSMGSMTRATWGGNAMIGLALLLSLPIMIAASWQLTALRLGDARAQAMGVNVNRLRMVMLIVVALLSATAVAFAGIIGFVGLVGPHVARIFVGEDQRYFLPASMAAGALIMSGAHAASLLIIPGIAIPIGIITALLGVPCFMLIILSRKRVIW
ncbi:iron ABC transporter permease [Corynebacterium sp. H127]|uniref:FecCD family ABC transporter permease n=1 Tax=Corynebacterium sp. H127 TaxID=3133418 RepID=UPI003096C70C